MSDFGDLTLGGMRIVLDDNVPNDRWYIVGSKAVDNLKANGVYQEWLDTGLLRVDVPLEGYEGTFAMIKG